jgi:hypothetical protein
LPVGGFSSSFVVKSPEISCGCVDVPKGTFTGPKEILPEELHDPDGSRGISTSRVKSRFFVTLSCKKVFGDAMMKLRKV